MGSNRIMNKRNFAFKLHWWVKEHLLFSHSPLQNEVMLSYTLPDEYEDFAVHPCVRYIPQAIGGHKWWLALSPYPMYDIKKENILLFHGIDESDDHPPQEWSFVKEVCGTHPQGFNSDPNLYYDGKELWVIWREWGTENIPAGVPYICVRCSRTKDGIHFSGHETIANNEFCEYSMQGDTTMCPIVVSHKGKITMYGSYYAYEPFLRPIGVSRYLLDGHFFRMDGFHHHDNMLFDLWHFDLFEYNGYLYQVITGQFGNAIYVGRSEDGKVFKYSKKPLYAYPWFLKKNFFYKPTAQVLGSKLFVFFPRKKEKGSLRIVVRSMDAEVLERFDYR